MKAAKLTQIERQFSSFAFSYLLAFTGTAKFYSHSFSGPVPLPPILLAERCSK